MAVYQLLLRGMLVGLVAGLLAFGFAKVFGEPQVDRAIAFEAGEAQAKGERPEPDLVSRHVQSSSGLFVGVTIVGTALGGLFSLVFAVCYGRVSRLSPKVFAAVLALICFAAIYVVPNIKYPANPPSVGEAATIGLRTGLYFSMIAISIIATIVAFSLRRLLLPRFGDWNASVLGVFAFILLVAAAQLLLPVVDEVPDGFPAQTLWTFRLAGFGIYAILWGVIGLLFGALTERSLKA